MYCLQNYIYYDILKCISILFGLVLKIIVYLSYISSVIVVDIPKKKRFNISIFFLENQNLYSITTF